MGAWLGYGRRKGLGPRFGAETLRESRSHRRGAEAPRGPWSGPPACHARFLAGIDQPLSGCRQEWRHGKPEARSTNAPPTSGGFQPLKWKTRMVKAGRAESVGEAVDKAVEMARKLDNRATLERQTAAYFKGLTSKAAAEETAIEDALSAFDPDLPPRKA